MENGQLDYLITVDIFNEGIDIPELTVQETKRLTFLFKGLRIETKKVSGKIPNTDRQ